MYQEINEPICFYLPVKEIVPNTIDKIWIKSTNHFDSFEEPDQETIFDKIVARKLFA